MQSTKLGLVLLTAVALLPSTDALPVPGYDAAFTGTLAVRAEYVYGLVPCEDEGDAILQVTGRGVPERADFLLEVDTSCGNRKMHFQGHLEEDGWRLGDGSTVKGYFRPDPDKAHTYDLWLQVATCPPLAICEFPLATTTYAGEMEPAVTIHQV